MSNKNLIAGFTNELKTFRIEMRCGHIEDRLMDPQTVRQLKSEMDCSECRKKAAVFDPASAGELHAFYPEMDQKRDADRLFFSRHVWGSSYSIQWAAARDAEARAVIKKLRVRPVGGRGVSHNVPGENHYYGKQECYDMLISSSSFDKLQPYISYEMLLD
jgi:hypothetical protein